MANKVFITQDHESTESINFNNSDSTLSELDNQGYPYTITGASVATDYGDCAVDREGNVWYAPYTAGILKINTKTGATTVFQASLYGYKFCAYDPVKHQLFFGGDVRFSGNGGILCLYDIATNSTTLFSQDSYDFCAGVYFCENTKNLNAVFIRHPNASGVLRMYSVIGGVITARGGNALVSQCYSYGLGVTFSGASTIIFIAYRERMGSSTPNNIIVKFDSATYSNFSIQYSSPTSDPSREKYFSGCIYIGENKFLAIAENTGNFHIHKFTSSWIWEGVEYFPIGNNYKAFSSARMLADGRVLFCPVTTNNNYGWWIFDPKTNTITEQTNREYYPAQDFAALPDGRIVYKSITFGVQNYVKTFIEPYTISKNLSVHGTVNKH